MKVVLTRFSISAVVGEERDDHIAELFEGVGELGVLFEDEEKTTGAADLHGRVAQPPQDPAVIEEFAEVLEEIETLRRLVADPLERRHGVVHPLGADGEEAVDTVPDGEGQGVRFGGAAEAFQELLLALLLHAHHDGQWIRRGEGGAHLVVGRPHEDHCSLLGRPARSDSPSRPPGARDGESEVMNGGAASPNLGARLVIIDHGASFAFCCDPHP